MPPKRASKTGSTMAERDDPVEVFELQDNLALDADEEYAPVIQSSLVLWNRRKTLHKPFKLPLKILPPSTDPRPLRTTRRTRASHLSFFSLPLELRRQIYEYALPEMPQMCPQGHSRGPACKEEPWEGCNMLQSSTDINFPCRGYTALLCTSKAIHAEAVDVLYSPIRGHIQTQDNILKLVIASEGISLRGFPLFCPVHWRYRIDAEHLFAKLRYVDVVVLGDIAPDDFYDSDDTQNGFGAEDFDDFDAVNRLRDNVEWAVLQLQRATQLSNINIRLLWERQAPEFQHGRLRPTLKHCKIILRPFQGLRHISEPNLLKIDPYGAGETKWENHGASLTALLEEAWKRKVVDLMSGHDPVKQPPPINQNWWQFMVNIKRLKSLYGFQSRANAWLCDARRAKRIGDEAEFWGVLTEIEWSCAENASVLIDCEKAASKLARRFR
ncbi:hypothetical protein K490DRAFT_61616 [Saccharata proteae CBS 121410]|uniref:DUF7730 domain-containing protein n=1 Tax=Saccharata proteae CBS 121410 TaxID=1314787 RepID=A0A9P4M2D4_9PEZI|nr:hypothetical protein K490DRAFT_61616 [Saccharata proteae CBS 121410]